MQNVRKSHIKKAMREHHMIGQMLCGKTLDTQNIETLKGFLNTGKWEMFLLEPLNKENEDKDKMTYVR